MTEIPSPYRYSPVDEVFLGADGRYVFWRETSSRRYEVFELHTPSALSDVDTAEERHVRRVTYEARIRS